MKKAISLINRLEFDESDKKEFVEELETRLFEQYESFASNPLLLTMMLLTYSQYKDVPSRVFEFYSQAFDTLYQRHDSNKKGYKRKRYSEFTRSEFKNIFSTFCWQSYEERHLQFTEDELSSRVKDAIEFESPHRGGSTYDYIKDLKESVCLIKSDGLGYSFSHRSFQEYFAAVFLANESISTSEEDNFFDALNEIASRQHSDNVFSMLREMNPDKFEQRWLLVRLKSMLSKIPESKSNWSNLQAIFSRLMLRDPEKHHSSYRSWSLLDGDSNYSDIDHYVYEEFPEQEVKKHFDEVGNSLTSVLRVAGLNEYFDDEGYFMINLESRSTKTKKMKESIIASGFDELVVSDIRIKLRIRIEYLENKKRRRKKGFSRRRD